MNDDNNYRDDGLASDIYASNRQLKKIGGYKKMELTTNQKKELLTKKNVARSEYIPALTALASGSKEFKGLKEWQRARGAYRLYDTKYYRLARLCHILNIKYLECNNAPNGGQTGAYIKIKRHLSPGKIQLIRSLLDN